MMFDLRKIVVLGTIVLLAACRSPIAEKDISALIVEPTANSRAELLGVVSEALDHAEITLADDALVHASQLIITRKQHKTIQNGVLLGRSYEFPEHFNLVLNQGRCMLIRKKTGKRWQLKQTRCIVNDAL